VIALSRTASIDVRAKIGVVDASNRFLDISDSLLTKRHCPGSGAQCV